MPRGLPFDITDANLCDTVLELDVRRFNATNILPHGGDPHTGVESIC